MKHVKFIRYILNAQDDWSSYFVDIFLVSLYVIKISAVDWKKTYREMHMITSKVTIQQGLGCVMKYAFLKHFVQNWKNLS